MKPCEVAVVGAGIVGAATAWELYAHGVDVALLDRGEVSGATTGLGEGNVLCSDKEVGPELALTLAGLEVYDELEERLGDGARIRRKGALVVHRGEQTWAAEPARIERLRAAGVQGRLLDLAETRAMEPQLTGALAGASFFPADLQCAPRAIARALAGALPRVQTGLEVHGVEVAQDRVTALRTSEGSQSAAKLLQSRRGFAGDDVARVARVLKR